MTRDLLSEATAIAADGTTAAGSNQPQAATSTGARSTRYYLNIRLPERDTRSTSSSRVPFVPVSSGNSQTRLVSFLAANSDPEQYGKLSSFTMPQGQTVARSRAGEQPDRCDRDDLARRSRC